MTYIFDGVIFRCDSEEMKKQILKCLLYCQHFTNVGIKISPWNPDKYFLWNMIEQGFLQQDRSRKISNTAYPTGSVYSALHLCGIQFVPPDTSNDPQMFSVE